MVQMDAAQFNRALRRQPSRDACGALFQETIAPYGFDTFACGEVDFKTPRTQHVPYHRWPPAWTKFYMNSG